MKKILIFGLSGFIGRNLKKYIKNYKIYAFENNKKIPKNKNITPVRFSLNSKRDIEFFKNKIDYVINLSWYGIPNFTKKNNNLNINLNKKIIDFSKNKNAKKVFISGSCFEYDPKEIYVNEKSKVTNKNKLGITKLKIKKNAKKVLKNKLIWGRIFYVYGNGQRKNSLLSYAKEQLLKNKKIKIRNPLCFNDFINVNDVCKIILGLLENNKRGTYNICNGRPVFNFNFLEEQLLTKIKFSKQSHDVSGFFGSNLKIKKLKI